MAKFRFNPVRLGAQAARFMLTGSALVCAAAQAQQGDAPDETAPSLPEVRIESHYDNALGSSDAASQGSIQAELIKNRPALRPGEVLEFVPGMVVTQHSGDGKANQYFLRGFNLDHGTDFATQLNGVPINMPTHAHGQGYSDLNLLIPELVERVDYRKGPYFASEGDFSAAGSAAIVYKTRLDAPFASVEAGSRGFRRALAAGSGELRPGGVRWLGALELMGNDGPWTVPERLRKTNAVFTLSDGDRANGWSASLMSYRARWTSTDQIPERLVGQPYDGRVFGRFDSLDASDGGNTARTSMSGEWRRSEGNISDKISVYALHSSLDLFSNFTYFTKGPQGDQFAQQESRHALGLSASRSVAHALAGARDSQTTFGLQVRHDRIHVGLHDSAERQITGTVRDDAVRQTLLGLHAENTTQWQPWLRTVAGLRWDQLSARVDSRTLAANSGSSRAALWSPKASVILGPWRQTEVFFNIGRGFHSNDARGTAARIDPADGVTPIERVPGLVPAVGYEVGVRGEWLPGLQSSVALWQLNSRSELVYVGDEGKTEPGQASRRHGIEWNTRWIPRRWLVLDADLAWTHARFANGSRIDNAVDKVAVASVTLRQLPQLPGWTATLAWRYIGPAALSADNRVRSRSSVTTNLRVAYEPNARWALSLDVFNLFNRRNDDIQYFYASQLPGEVGPVEGRHVHPGEPRALRLMLKMKF